MLNEILRLCAITQLFIIVLQFLKTGKSNNNSWFAIAFTVSIICYLIVDWKGELNSVLFAILLVGPFLLPVFFWLLSKSIFDDHFKMDMRYVAIIFILLGLQYASFYQVSAPASSHAGILILLIPKFLSFGFMLLGVFEAVRNRKYDLIDSRLRFRNTFIIITASTIGITLLVEGIGLGIEIPEILPTLQKATIAFLAFIFIYYNLELNLSFFLHSDKSEKAKPDSAVYQLITGKITTLLKDEKIYRTEGLTISQLAKTLKEQEHLVRRTINGQLGFKNFNDFLNKYRVQEACTILQDPDKSDLTILEIAYSLGYQSIGPFNKSFKEQTGLTPTAFRKQKIQ